MTAGTPGPDYDPGAASHRALRDLRRELERHPAVSTARGFPPDVHSQVTAELHPDRVGRDVESATLEVRWFAGKRPDDPPQFTFHYSEASGIDLGWHHEPNPHVEEWGHYQQRVDPSDEYAYEPHAFSTLVPARVVWEVLSDLEDTLATL